MPASCGLDRKDIELLLGIFAEYEQIREVILFGSRAMGTFKPGSDIDIALKGRDLGAIITALSGRLENDTPLPYKFDLIDYSSIAEPKLKEHIDRYGRALSAL